MTKVRQGGRVKESDLVKLVRYKRIILQWIRFVVFISKGEDW